MGGAGRGEAGGRGPLLFPAAGSARTRGGDGEMSEIYRRCVGDISEFSASLGRVREGFGFARYLLLPAVVRAMQITAALTTADNSRVDHRR